MESGGVQISGRPRGSQDVLVFTVAAKLKALAQKKKGQIGLVSVSSSCFLMFLDELLLRSRSVLEFSPRFSSR